VGSSVVSILLRAHSSAREQGELLVTPDAPCPVGGASIILRKNAHETRLSSISQDYYLLIAVVRLANLLLRTKISMAGAAFAGIYLLIIFACLPLLSAQKFGHLKKEGIVGFHFIYISRATLCRGGTASYTIM
jgi:hypothetical protein